MIGLLLSILPLFIYSYFFFFLRKKKDDARFDIDYGLICYSCQEEVISFEEKLVNNNFSLDLNLKKDHKLCLSCQRDEKLNKLTSKKINKRAIKRFLLSDNINKYSNTLLILALSSIILGIFFNSIIIRNIGNLFNTAYALLFIMRFAIYINKKPSH